MAVGILLDGVRAEVRDGGKWICEDPYMERLLKTLPCPTGYYPGGWSIDMALAEEAVSQLGAVMIWCEVAPRFDTQDEVIGRVY